jgi:hypothetical protein
MKECCFLGKYISEVEYKSNDLENVLIPLQDGYFYSILHLLSQLIIAAIFGSKIVIFTVFKMGKLGL